jgi:hypothetical protein
MGVKDLKFLHMKDDGLRAFPPVLSMWLQIVKFIAKKSKCASLIEEIGFLHQIRASCCGWWKAQHNGAPTKKSVINWTWLRLNIFDWLIMIVPGGLLLIVPTYMQFRLQFYWWGCPQKNQLNLDI